MSRTIRRKGIEVKSANQSLQTNIAGRYTVYDFVEGYTWYIVHREPTPEERYKEWKHFHHDGGYGYTGCVPKDGRRIEQKSYRQAMNARVRRFLRGITEDIVLCPASKAQMQYW